MPTQKEAEDALKFIRETALDYEGIVSEALDTERLWKLEMAKAVVSMEDANTPTKVPATVRKEHAVARDAVQAAIKEANKKAAHRIGIDARIDAADKTLMLYMSMNKAKM